MTKIDRLTARLSAHTHQSLSLETSVEAMKTRVSFKLCPSPERPSPGCSTQCHVPREEEKRTTPIRSRTHEEKVAACRHTAEALNRIPLPDNNGWRSDRQKAQGARAKAKAEAEAVRLKQEKEEDEKDRNKKVLR